MTFTFHNINWINTVDVSSIIADTHDLYNNASVELTLQDVPTLQLLHRRPLAQPPAEKHQDYVLDHLGPLAPLLRLFRCLHHYFFFYFCCCCCCCCSGRWSRCAERRHPRIHNMTFPARAARFARSPAEERSAVSLLLASPPPHAQHSCEGGREGGGH